MGGVERLAGRGPVFGVNAITMGCIVQPGEHTVVFRYAPASFPAGCAISAATLGLGIAAVFGRRSRASTGLARTAGLPADEPV